MPKSFQSCRKGQWFLISAVVATGAFLLVSTIFKSYFVTDPSLTARHSESIYYDNIRNEFKKIISSSNCPQVEDELKNFRVFVEREMSKKGYLVYMNHTRDCPPITRNIGLLVASEKVVLCQNIWIPAVLPSSIVLDCDNV